MEVIHPRCAGVDVSKKDAKVCVRVQGQGRRGTSTTVSTWGSTSGEIVALSEHLIAKQVSCVVMESTSDYWKPFYYLLEDQLNVMLVNAKAARTAPGRKTDVSDAAWLADLGAHGLIRASFVPPPPVRVLRDLTRTRTTITRARTKEIQRLEKLLEDAGIKLSAVASNIVGVSGRAMLEALIAGERNPAVLAELAKQRLRHKIPALTEALCGRFNEHHAFMVRLYLDRIDAHAADIARLDARIEEAIAPFRCARELLMSIPGWSQIIADVFIAETGADMMGVSTAENLASWDRVVPGCNESAGRVKSAGTRPGNRHLKAALGVAALLAARSKDTYSAARAFSNPPTFVARKRGRVGHPELHERRQVEARHRSPRPRALNRRGVGHVADRRLAVRRQLGPRFVARRVSRRSECPRAASRRATERPRKPVAPVTRTFIACRRRRPPRAPSSPPGDRRAICSSGIRGSQAVACPQPRGVSHLSRNVGGPQPPRIDAHLDLGPPESPEQHVEHLADAAAAAAADVVDLAGLALVEQQAVGAHHVAHVAEVAHGVEVPPPRSRAAPQATLDLRDLARERALRERLAATRARVVEGPRQHDAHAPRRTVEQGERRLRRLADGIGRGRPQRRRPADRQLGLRAPIRTPRRCRRRAPPA